MTTERQLLNLDLRLTPVGGPLPTMYQRFAKSSVDGRIGRVRHTGGYVYFSQSLDGGYTWTADSLIYDCTGQVPSHYVYYASIVCDSTGNFHVGVSEYYFSTYAYFMMFHLAYDKDTDTWAAARQAQGSWKANNGNVTYRCGLVCDPATDNLYFLYLEDSGAADTIRMGYYTKATDTWAGNGISLINLNSAYSGAGVNIGSNNCALAVTDGGNQVHAVVAWYSGATETTWALRHIWMKWNIGGWWDTGAWSNLQSPTGDISSSDISALTIGSGFVVGGESYDLSDTFISFYEWDDATEAWVQPVTEIPGSRMTSSYPHWLDWPAFFEFDDGTVWCMWSSTYWNPNDPAGGSMGLMVSERPSGGSWQTGYPYLYHAPQSDIYGVYKITGSARDVTPYGEVAAVVDAYGYGGYSGTLGAIYLFRGTEDTHGAMEEQEFTFEYLPDFNLYEDGELLGPGSTTKLLDNTFSTDVVSYKKLIVENTTPDIKRGVMVTVASSATLGTVQVAAGNPADGFAEANSYSYGTSAMIPEIAASGQGAVWVKWTRPSTEDQGSNSVSLSFKVA